MMRAAPVFLLAAVAAGCYSPGLMDSAGFLLPTGLGVADLQTSFLVPAGASGVPSHTPALAFDAEGEALVVATASGEVVVFDAETQALRRRVGLPEEGGDAVSISSSGRTAAWVLKSGRVAVVDVASGQASIPDSALSAEGVALSPDGKTLAVWRGAALELRELPLLRPHEKLGGHASAVTAAAWAPDGKTLASVGRDGRLVLHAPGKPGVALAKEGQALYAVAFNPDGRRIAFGGHSRRISEYDLATGSALQLSQDQPYWITHLGYSPDGAWLAVGDESCDIWLYDLKARERKFHYKHHVECWLSSVAWTPDGERLAFGCRPNGSGTPTRMPALSRAEAVRTGEARAARLRLLEALDDAVEDATPSSRGPLDAYRKSIESDEARWGEASRQDPPRELPPAAREAAAHYRQTVDSETRRVDTHFPINLWKIAPR